MAPRPNLVLVAIAGLLLAFAQAPATGAPRARRGTLTGDTTITWTGNAGIRLATTGSGSLPEESMTLFLRGGTYAFVTMMVDPQPRGCAENTIWPHCYGFSLSKFPHAGDMAPDHRPGRDHLTTSPDPPNIIGRRLDLYLMTDGHATVRLRPRGYRGRSAYIAGGTIRGRATRLPGSCEDVCGTTAASELVAGGATFDFGTQPGHVITHAYGRGRPKASGAPAENRPMSVRTCYYPNPFEPEASPTAADHPQGCDTAPSGSGQPGYAAGEALTSLWFGNGSYMSWNVGDQVGKSYIGFWAGEVSTERGEGLGYGVWFNYGIR